MPWHQKREIDGLRVNRCLTLAERDAASDAEIAARVLGMPLTLRLIVRADIDHLSPVERCKFWGRVDTKIRAHCRWQSIPCAFVRIRESDALTHSSEHAHYRVACPECRIEHFIAVAAGWSLTGKDSVGLDVVGKRITPPKTSWNGREVSAEAYDLKASAQAAYGDATVTYRSSGAIVGPRMVATRNISSAKVKVGIADQLEAGRRAKARIKAERAQIARMKRQITIAEIHAAARRQSLENEHIEASADAAAASRYPSG